MKNRVLLLLFVASALVIYFPTRMGGMVYDFTGWVLLFEKSSFLDAIKGFNYNGLHQVENLTFYTLHKVFGMNYWGWYFVFSSLHGLIAYTLFLLLKRIFGLLDNSQTTTLALASSFLFLISPLAVEAVCEKVNIHYLISTLSILLGLHALLYYFQTKKILYLFLNIGSFLIALFSLEISYAYPLAHTLFCMVLFGFSPSFKNKFERFVLIIYPFFILLGYLVLHKCLIGTFVGHYGSATHLHFNLAELTSNTFRYLLSYIAFFDYWPYTLKTALHKTVMQHVYWLLPLALTAFTAFTLWLHKKAPNQTKLFLLLFFTALFFLAPVANLYYVDVLAIENDRYGYLFSIFLIPSAVILLHAILLGKRRILISIIGFYILGSTIFTAQNITWYNASAKLSHGLFNSFKWHNKHAIILFGIDNYRGIKLFRTSQDTPIPFAESLYLNTGLDRRDEIFSVYQMNYTSLSDSTYVNIIDTNLFEVGFKQWGNWIWKNRRDLRKEGIKLAHEKHIQTRVRGDNLAFQFEIIDLPDHFIIIYPQGTTWKELDL